MSPVETHRLTKRAYETALIAENHLQKEKEDERWYATVYSMTIQNKSPYYFEELGTHCSVIATLRHQRKYEDFDPGKKEEVRERERWKRTGADRIEVRLTDVEVDLRQGKVTYGQGKEVKIGTKLEQVMRVGRRDQQGVIHYIYVCRPFDCLVEKSTNVVE